MSNETNEPYALISDVHACLGPLEEVIDDIHERGIDRIYCAGDVVGYGAENMESIDIVRMLDGCVKGNHEIYLDTAVKYNLPEAALAHQMGSDAAKSIVFAKNQLRELIEVYKAFSGIEDEKKLQKDLRAESKPRNLDSLMNRRYGGKEELQRRKSTIIMMKSEEESLRDMKREATRSQERIDFLDQLPYEIQLGNLKLLHAPKDENDQMDYVLTRKLSDQFDIKPYTRIEEVFSNPELFSEEIDIVAMGHTHIPGIYTKKGEKRARSRDRIIERGKNEKVILALGSTALSRKQDYGVSTSRRHIKKPVYSDYAIIDGNKIELVTLITEGEKSERLMVDARLGNKFERTRRENDE